MTPPATPPTAALPMIAGGNRIPTSAPTAIPLVAVTNGAALVPLAVPANPAIVGVRATVQSVAVDPVTWVAELSTGLLVTVYP